MAVVARRYRTARVFASNAEVIGEREMELARARIPLVMQPNFVATGWEDGMYEARLGHERWLAQPVRSPRGATSPLCFRQTECRPVRSSD